MQCAVSFVNSVTPENCRYRPLPVHNACRLLRFAVSRTRLGQAGKFNWCRFHAVSFLRSSRAVGDTGTSSQNLDVAVSCDSATKAKILVTPNRSSPGIREIVIFDRNSCLRDF